MSGDKLTLAYFKLKWCFLQTTKSKGEDGVLPEALNGPFGKEITCLVRAYF